MDERELREILSGCIAGKEKYQQKLYDLYFGKMMAICMRYARDRDEARDMLHEGYIRIFKSLNQYNFTGSFESWMRKIIVNAAINYFNRTNQKNQMVYIDEDSQLESAHDTFSKEDIFNQFAVQELLMLVQALSPAYRMVFNLYAIEGYSHKEIAEMLHINEGTSKSNLAKARQKLQMQINQVQKMEGVKQ